MSLDSPDPDVAGSHADGDAPAEELEDLTCDFGVPPGWEEQLGDYGYRRPVDAEDEVAALVPSYELKGIAAQWVPPPEFARARQALDRHHLLVLRGPPRMGRRTMALRALQDLGHTRIWEFDPSVDPHRIHPEGLSAGVGFMATLPASQTPFAEVRARRFSDVLSARGSRLVLLASTTVRPAGHPPPGWWHELSQPAAPAQLLPRAVRAHLAGRPLVLDLDALLSRSEVRALIASGAHQMPGDVVSLGRLLARVAVGELDLATALAGLDEHQDAEVERWFAASPPAAQVVSAMVLAALEGAPVTELSAACQTLERALGVEGPAPSSGRSLFGSRQDRFEAIGAIKGRVCLQTEFGQVEVPSARYARESRAAAILRHAWHAGAEDLPAFLSWLGDSAAGASPPARASLARAAVELLRWDTNTAVRSLLLPWARSTDRRVRRVAADALAQASRAEVAEEELIRLLVHWATQGGNLELCATALRACGATLGRRYPARGLQLVGRALALHGARLLDDVEVAMRELLVARTADPMQALEAVAALVMWSDAGRPPQMRQAALGLFLRLGHGLLARDPSGDRPLLPWLAARSHALSVALAELLRRAIREPTTRQGAGRLLSRWVGRADAELPARAELLVVLVEVLRSAGGDYEQGRIRYELGRIEARGPGPSPTLQDLAKETQSHARL